MIPFEYKQVPVPYCVPQEHQTLNRIVAFEFSPIRLIFQTYILGNRVKMWTEGKKLTFQQQKKSNTHLFEIEQRLGEK